MKKTLLATVALSALLALPGATKADGGLVVSATHSGGSCFAFAIGDPNYVVSYFGINLNPVNSDGTPNNQFSAAVWANTVVAYANAGKPIWFDVSTTQTVTCRGDIAGVAGPMQFPAVANINSVRGPGQ